MSQSFLFRTALTTSTIWQICAAHFCSKEEIISQENTTGVFFHVQEERPASPQASLNCLRYLAFFNTVLSRSIYTSGVLNSAVLCWSPFSWINWPLLTAWQQYKGIFGALKEWRYVAPSRLPACTPQVFGSTCSGSFQKGHCFRAPHASVSKGNNICKMVSAHALCWF